MHHILNGVGRFILFCSVFFVLVEGGLLSSLLPLCIAILYLKVEVGLCNQQMYLTVQAAWCLWGHFPQ